MTYFVVTARKNYSNYFYYHFVKKNQPKVNQQKSWLNDVIVKMWEN